MTQDALFALSVVVVLVVVILAILAGVVAYRARRAEAEHPPSGRFLDVDGVRLHYIEHGTGIPVVLIHGNVTRAEDFQASGVFERLVAHHRVVAFDRPGYGFSERPRSRSWTPEGQANLLVAAFDRLGLDRPVVVGHSWGTLVALALGLDHPERVRGLVLLSGYYYPTMRPDVLVFGAPAIPVIGDVMRYTVSPLLGKLMAPGLIRGMFTPAPVPEQFYAAVPIALMLRPWQIRASAEDAALMVPAAARFRRRYGELRIPVQLIAGADDPVAHVERHSAQLHREVPSTDLRVIPGLGHMVHYFAQAEVIEAVDAVSRSSPGAGQRSA